MAERQQSYCWRSCNRVTHLLLTFSKSWTLSGTRTTTPHFCPGQRWAAISMGGRLAHHFTATPTAAGNECTPNECAPSSHAGLVVRVVRRSKHLADGFAYIESLCAGALWEEIGNAEPVDLDEQLANQAEY
ncbi:hypothetical protein HRR83_005382 [Exophiala dermatitidis]|uniref:Uncharacterized protein n=1 Tax=Exophiala dermatitidis TaxID=5970 RepID=A0AAN6ETH2_EXODE|nr:hypothetical protein HRR74_005235 [Exophiala dermatitidis]KAJ4518517.1 hypothetical protein HRR73_004098 [Exophiala dermatitidis]KAJ4534016.1 hypothetical protein HRR76_005963 [Exophiala dermatitidis]KAJ4550172.1 hypothetical protein HRR77_003649 [Exophiala dermatitidis]KAJ4571581.1 hypothetical protein HRR81_005612 [Exophiala dermatitidis]